MAGDDEVDGDAESQALVTAGPGRHQSNALVTAR